MRQPLPWSYTALQDFINCPNQFYHKRVIKSVKEEQGEAQIWGEKVHKAFEERQSDGLVLPDILAEHEQRMDWLQNQKGKTFTERKIALNKKAQPCEFFDKDVWFRGIIDYMKVDGDFCRIVDYKTGKVKNDFKQLKLFALHTFIAYPEIQNIICHFYWLTDKSFPHMMFHRAQMPAMWHDFIPDLQQYKEAFKMDVWQKRQSGLCNGWCPVTTCENWKPKRGR